MASRSPLFALLAGDTLRAADLYYQAGKLEKAAELYAKAGNLRQAAKISVELGRIERAVELYQQAGSPQLAGDLLAAAGRHKDAIALYEAASAFWQAAEAATQVGQTARAARLYERAKAWGSAAKAFEKAGMVEDAIRMLEQELKRLEPGSSERLDPAAREASRAARVKLAELSTKVGRLAEAAETLRGLGLPLQAAPLFERAGAWKEALEAWIAGGDADAAHRLLDRVPSLDPRRRAEIMLRVGAYREAAPLLLAAGAVGEAAEAFENAGDVAAAAELWERAAEPGRAAEAYLRAGDTRAAARCFAAVGNLAAAADSYAKAGDHAAAAELYERLGQHLRAASHYLEHGDRERGLAALQSVEPGGAAYERATLLLVPLLLEDGLADAALHRLQMLPTDRATGLALFDRMYWEGRVLEASGRLREAHDSYQRLLAMRRGHRDVATRANALAARLEAELRETTPVSGLRAPSGVLRVTPSGGQTAGLESSGSVAVGTLVADRYEILSELGRGGMSRVFRAKDRILGEEVAIKTMLREGGEGGVETERLLREVQICRRITHPNVVRVYDIGQLGSGIFITMELIEGTRLDQLLKDGERLPLAQVRSILQQTVAGLAVAHELNIVHRDLKPGNIILSPKGLKILDFGIARQEGHDNRLTHTGEAMGSPLYMSPEQIQGAPLDGRSDLYALGVMAFTLLAGHEPFLAKTPTAVAVQHLHEPPPDLGALRPDLPQPWVELVTRLLAKRPEDRYPNAAAVADLLATLPA
jgi:tetratricopeptide (TPR) repeat protein